MSDDVVSLREQLEHTVTTYRHVRDEHRRAGVDGTTRRHHERRLEELAAQLERLLDDAEVDTETRRQWQEHLHRGAPPPAVPAPGPPRARSLPWRRRWRRGRRSPLWQR